MNTKNTIKSLGLVFILITCNAWASLSINHPTCIMVSKTILAWMKHNHIPGASIQIYQNGKAHSYYFGFADLGSKKPVTEETIFEVGSFTKLFTSLLLAEEVNSNKMQLQDPIIKYLPDLITNSQLSASNLENLATHTTGLPLYLSKTIANPTDLSAYFTYWQPPAAIGSVWAYSNVGIGLLGKALEAANHQDINQLFLKNILKPLHMKPIGLAVPKALMPSYAQGYNTEGMPVPPIKLGLFPAAGAMKITAKDGLLFLKAAIGLPDVPQNIINAIHTSQTPYFSVDNMQQGLAWNIYPLAQHKQQELLNLPTNMNMGPMPAQPLAKEQIKYNSYALIDKTGATDGFRAYIAVIPKQKSGIVIMINRYVSNSEIVKIGREILFNIATNHRPTNNV